MANKLKNMRLTSVDMVRNGANQEADICLFKSAEETPTQPTAEEKNIFKRFLNWLRENPTEDGGEPETPVEKADDLVDVYKSAITESLQSIIADETLSAAEKNDLIAKSLDEYHDAMLDLFDIAKADSEEDEDEWDWDEDEDEEDDEVEEIEKFNPHHDSQGRFASGGGSAGASGAKAKLKSDLKAALSNLERATFEAGYGYERKEASRAWNKLYAEDMDLGNEVLDEAGIVRTKTSGWKWPEKLGKSSDIDEIEEV